VTKRIQKKGTRDAALQTMVDEGFLKPASRKGPTPAPHWRPVNVKGKPLSQTVIDDREDRVSSPVRGTPKRLASPRG
jgi:hypothetical protein